MVFLNEQYYDNWHKIKKNLASKNGDVIFSESEVWWCSVGMNLGQESFGKGDDFRRPVLVLKKLSSKLCIVLPISSKIKNGNWFTSIFFDSSEQTVLLYQIRTVDVAKRFQRKIGNISFIEFNKIKQELKRLLKLL